MGLRLRSYNNNIVLAVTVILVGITVLCKTHQSLAFFVSTPTIITSRSRWVSSSSSTSSSSSSRDRSWITMRVSRGRAKGAGLKGSTVTQVNLERITSAGKLGRKNFKDPNRVFVGNLPFTATEDDLRTFLEVRGIPVNYMVQSIKVIRDWRTKESKGYAFLQFRTPIFATSALVSLNNSKSTLQGRILRFHQGQKKPDPTTIYITNESKADENDQESQIISNAIQYDKNDEEAEEDDEEDELYDEYFDFNDEEVDMDEESYDDDDDDRSIQTSTSSNSTTPMASNRAIRRKAERAMTHRKKKILRGFGDL